MENYDLLKKALPKSVFNEINTDNKKIYTLQDYTQKRENTRQESRSQQGQCQQQ